MPYTINKYNGTKVTVVADGTIDNSLDVKLIGKNYAGYGEIQNENFVFLLENFANNSQPLRPITGQIWFDTANSRLKFYDGAKFRATSCIEVAGVSPTGLVTGDFWFDNSKNQLYTWNGTDFTLIGPQGVGQTVTQMVSVLVYDTNGAVHPIIKAVVNDSTLFIISSDSDFILDDVRNAIPGFTLVRQGVTLTHTNSDGHTTQASYRYWGTASDSDKLGGLDASYYAASSNAVFTGLTSFGDAGFTVGDIPRLSVSLIASVPTVKNTIGNSIVFQTTVNSVLVTPAQLVGLDVLPGADNVSSLGSASLRYKELHAVTITGTTTQANTLLVDNLYYEYGTVDPIPGTVVARTRTNEVINGFTVTAGAIKGTYFVGTATSANYADLAEKYLADDEYEVGTVVMVGGDKEITACQIGKRAFGAVSNNPAYLMNASLEDGTAIALKGRVPVKVSGAVAKGDRLIAGPDGTAICSTSETSAEVFAISLENSPEDGIKLIECLIL